MAEWGVLHSKTLWFTNSLISHHWQFPQLSALVVTFHGMMSGQQVSDLPKVPSAQPCKSTCAPLDKDHVLHRRNRRENRGVSKPETPQLMSPNANRRVEKSFPDHSIAIDDSVFRIEDSGWLRRCKLPAACITEPDAKGGYRWLVSRRHPGARRSYGGIAKKVRS